MAGHRERQRQIADSPIVDLLTSSLRFYGSTAQGSCGKDGTHAQRWWHRGAEEGHRWICPN